LCVSSFPLLPIGVGVCVLPCSFCPQGWFRACQAACVYRACVCTLLTPLSPRPVGSDWLGRALISTNIYWSWLLPNISFLFLFLCLLCFALFCFVCFILFCLSCLSSFVLSYLCGESMDPCISNGLQLFPFAHHKLCTHLVLRQVVAFFIQPGLRHARVGVELGSSHFGLEDRTGHYLPVTFFNHVQHLWFAIAFVCLP